MSDNALPTIEEIVAKVTNDAKPADASTGKGGTTSDPNLKVEKAEEKPEVKDVEKPEVKEPKEKEKDPVSSRFGALARKEKEIRQREKEFEAKLKAAEDREKALLEKESRLGAAKKNPLQVLKEYGFSYQDATEAVLGGFKEPEDDPLDVKIKPYAEKVSKYESETAKLAEQLEKLQTELVQRQQQEYMSQVTASINDTLKDDKYELTRAMKEEGVDFVRNIMVEYYKAHERLLDYDEACQIAEDHYDKEYLGRLLETNKVKSRLTPQAPKPASAAKPASKPTLTNDLQTGTGATVDIDKLSKEEAIAYLSKKLQFKQN